VSTGKPIPPLTRRRRVFASPRTAADAIPTSLPLASLLPPTPHLPPRFRRLVEDGPGRPQPGRSRLLVAADGERLCAFPTERGAAKLLLVPGGGPDAVRKLEHGLVTTDAGRFRPPLEGSEFGR
jgi:hypothetical protein